MLISVAVCPHPPLLAPELAQGAAGELEGLRSACDLAVRRMLTAEPEVVVVVGAAPQEAGYASLSGSLRRYGVPAPAHPAAELPLSLVIGGWLLERAGTTVPRRGLGVPADAPTTRCLALGQQLAASGERIGLLVMGDGSARRTDKAPGHHDPRAADFDAAVATALGTADTGALAKLDPELGDELMAAGRAAWQVLGGAADGRSWRAALHYDDAPYGVGYLVASWTL